MGRLSTFVNQINKNNLGAEPFEIIRVEGLLKIGEKDFKNISRNRNHGGSETDTQILYVNLTDWIHVVRRYSFRSAEE